MSRNIAVVTTSRADYSHLYWPLVELQRRSEIELKLIVIGPHLAPEFGHTIDEIERDGFRIDERIECLLSSDTDVGMAKTIGVATLGCADVLGRMRPDLLLLIADRYEMLAPASVALALRLPIAHIEGGEVSEGAIDHAVRNALTMMSHVHLTPTARARERVIAMGEEEWRVHQVGAPSLDHLRRSPLMGHEECARELGVDFDRPVIVVAYHPVTLASDTNCEADEVFGALAQLADAQIVFCFPNTDAGSRALIRRATAFCERHASARLHVNLPAQKYWSLLRHSTLLIGNSSSGIMETPSLGLPTVNIGRRQQGRERAENILDAQPVRSEIVAAVTRARDPEFVAHAARTVNPYGDGHAAERIAQILAEVPVDDRLLVKRSRPIDGWGREGGAS